jgi:hypothetical protein
MPFPTATLDAAVNALTGQFSHISLLNESLTEISGGSPAYARNPLVWGSSSGGVADQDDDEIFNVPGSTTVAFLGFADHLTNGDGKQKGWWPLGGQTVKAGTAIASTDTITSPAHGLSNGHRAVFFDVATVGLPAGLVEGTVYYVVGAATDTFQVSTTLGGSAVNVTADGECFFVRCIPEVFNAQGTYKVLAGDLDVVGSLI